jgi:hypothetical protein
MKKRVIMMSKMVVALMPAALMICSDSSTLQYIAFLYIWWLCRRIADRNKEAWKRWLRMIEE